MPDLVDQYGQALKSTLKRELLTRDVAGPTLAGVRSPYAGYPADNLNPSRLANILKAAAQGDPLQYFELAELIEERDPHYVGVLATRRRSVSQIDITVNAASDDAADVAMADMVREWLDRDELADEIFHMLDAIGKGISFTEIVWDTSEGQWRPERLEWRDPRWFTFSQHDMRTPLLRGGVDGTEVASPLPMAKFIITQIQAKSGLPIRGGMARIAAWAWMFKAFTQRDWAIFTQTYGQPVRLGKYASGATKEDKATLFRAVANIAGDCAAIIPQSMEIEFVESNNVNDGSQLYERRADWLDRQISKAILGQTTTTDAVSGGHAVSKEHRKVQEDIERADCKALSAVINRDLVRVWIDLEFGPQKKYPRLVIGRPEEEDRTQMAEALAKLVPLVLRVQASEVRDKLGWSDPDAGSELLEPATPEPAAVPPVAPGAPPAPPARTAPALMAEAAPVAHPADQIAERLAAEAAPMVALMAERIEVMLEKAADLSEFRAMLASTFGADGQADLANAIAAGLSAAHAAGRSDLVDESA